MQKYKQMGDELSFAYGVFRLGDSYYAMCTNSKVYHPNEC